jgi:hypothetical protein
LTTLARGARLGDHVLWDRVRAERARHLRSVLVAGLTATSATFDLTPAGSDPVASGCRST